MATKNPITALIDEWPNRKALAEQIGARTEAVHKWALNGRIPSGWQQAVVDAAQAKGASYATSDWMLAQHAREPSEDAA